MGNLAEIKQRLDRLTELSNKMRGQFSRLSGPEAAGFKKKAKEEGTKIGIGAGISILGLSIAAVSCAYLTWVVVLLVNIALDRMWLSALIVVGGFLIIGGGIIGIGIAVIQPAAKELSRTTDDVQKQIKEAGEEMKAELDELQKVLKREAEEQQRQFKEMAEKAKEAAPVIAPVAAGAFLGIRFVKKRMRMRKEKRRILRVIELYEESKAGDRA